jgi:hypothetical protein
MDATKTTDAEDFRAEPMPPDNLPSGPTAADRAEHAAWCAAERPDDYDADPEPSGEPADFAAFLLAESGRLARLGTLAGYLAGQALADLYRDVVGYQSAADLPISAATYRDRRDTMARDRGAAK